MGILLVVLMVLAGFPGQVFADPSFWRHEWPRTDFSRTSVAFPEIFSGGPPKDGIPAIDHPKFKKLADVTDIGPHEPVIGLTIGRVAKAYPLRVLIWHEIVNDEIGGVPVAVTYCPLCNSSIVFDRRAGGTVLDFGTTGKLRNSDLVMYDRQTDSWWQQFTGTGIVGEMTGTALRMIPSRVESFESFRRRAPDGLVLVPAADGFRNYGANPYVGYDTAAAPFLYRGDMPEGIAPLAYVVKVGKQAWPLEALRARKTVESGELVLKWTPGRNSALDTRTISKGRDIGNVTVQRRGPDGMEDVVHDLTFAFVFHAFVPGGIIHK